MKVGDIIEIATPVVNDFPFCCPVGHWGAISERVLPTSTLRRMVGKIKPNQVFIPDGLWSFTEDDVKFVGRMRIKKVK